MLLQGLFSPKAAAVVGLDISTASVKLVELSFPAAGPRLERYVIEALPEGAVVDGDILNLELVVEALQRAWKRLGSRHKSVTMALPTAAAITKKIVVPVGLSEDELEVRVIAEADQYIPFDLDEVNLDFQVLPSTAPGSLEVEVLIVAARKERVEDRIAVAEAAGLRALALTVESFAMLAALEIMRQGDKDPALTPTLGVIDIGAHLLSLHVVRSESVIYSREQQFGGIALTRAIVRQYGLSTAEAEAMKRTATHPDDYHGKVLQPFLDDAVLEVSRALQFYQDAVRGVDIDQLILIGGSAVIPGLAEVIAASTGITTRVANPFANMPMASAVPRAHLRDDAPALMVACGLANTKVMA